MNMEKVSVVIPVYNEEDGLPRLFERLRPVMEGLDMPWEVVCVDDGSGDASLELLKSQADEHVHVVELTRNYGQHAAIFAGFASSDGEIVVTMDADLQNPPEEIPRLIRTMREGDYEVVGTVRVGRKDSWLRTVPSRMVNALTRCITGVHLTDWGCMLRAYRREVVDLMVNSREQSTFIPALATSFAKRITEIDVQHEERHAGESKYSFTKLVSLQFDLVTAFSEFPLKVLLYSGVIFALLGFGFGVVLAVARLAYGASWAAEGVFTLFAVLFFFIGAEFFAFGILGEYVGRIYRQVKHRPPFTIRRLY